jgi:hypothetical protein
MKITRISTVSGIERTLDLNITEEQLKAYKDGELIQNAFPNLTPDEREFFLTGISPEEWEELYPEEEGDGEEEPAF